MENSGYVVSFNGGESWQSIDQEEINQSILFQLTITPYFGKNNVSSVNAQTQNGIADYFLIRGFDSMTSGLVLTDGAAVGNLTGGADPLRPHTP